MKKSRLSFLSLSLAIILCFSLALTAADGTIAAKNLTLGPTSGPRAKAPGPLHVFVQSGGRLLYVLTVDYSSVPPHNSIKS